MPKIPSIEMLFIRYPKGTKEEVAKLIGGTVEKNIMNPHYKAYKDTCCIRVCRSLNYAGDPVPWAGGGIEGVRTDKGGDEKYYIYSTSDIRKYLNARYGVAKKFAGDVPVEQIKKIKGIIAFGYLHIDFWDGTKCAGHEYFGEERVMNDGIRIWETGSILDSRE